jgi:hypothetical protein
MHLLFGERSLLAHGMSPYQRLAKEDADVIPRMDYVWGLRLGAPRGQEAVVDMGTVYVGWAAKIQEGGRASLKMGPEALSCEVLRAVWGFERGHPPCR